ncbi:cytochrome P450 724B1 [Rosa rugosa]|uniref:cytochrome P450 724B1 n=1 Tax=Rosa rugosa TaxID=74645 RepID=UPI002B410B19|nr:cytochrome P450 724B1 [Rosa rugosa]
MFGFSPILLSFLLVLLPALAYILLIKLFRSRHAKLADHAAKNLPPGSMGWPVFGETLHFLKPHSSDSPGTFLQQHCSRYGKVFKSHLFGSPTIVSCDLELNMFVLQNEEKLFQASYPKPVHGILGKYSLLTVSGDLHRKLRNIGVSFIASSKSSPHFLHWIEKLSISMMDSWSGRNQVSFFKEAKAFTLHLMVKHLLSVNPEEALASRILEDFQTYMRGFVSLPINLPGTAYAKAVKARARLSSSVKEIMEGRRKRRIGELAELGDGEVDFLDAILSKQSLNDDEIVSIVLDIMLGGYETTSTLMALIVYFLHHSPIAFAKLKEEHQAIRENKEDESAPLDWEDYKKMEYSYNVICEAMRCGNVVKFVHRKALQDVKFKELVIPSGWKVLPIFTASHMDPDLHDNPAQFDPSRWTSDHYKEMSRKVTPFGGGARLCPGAELAKVVISFFLHHLVLTYRWKTKSDECPLAYPYVEFRRGLLIEIEPAAAGSDLIYREMKLSP